MVQTKNGYRKIEYKDIVILLRAVNSVANVFEKVFSENEIPLFSDCEGNYLDTPEVAMVLSLLKIIDNPDQDIDLVSILRSPIGDFTDNELVEIRLHDKMGSFYDAMLKSKDDTALGAKVTSFLNMIEEFQNKQEYMPLDEFIWYIYDKTGYYDYVSVMPNGGQKIANLKLLFERAKQYENASFKGLYNFIRFYK